MQFCLGGRLHSSLDEPLHYSQPSSEGEEMLQVLRREKASKAGDQGANVY